jgi:hypothetical protein
LEIGSSHRVPNQGGTVSGGWQSLYIYIYIYILMFIGMFHYIIKVILHAIIWLVIILFVQSRGCSVNLRQTLHSLYIN